MIVTEHLSVHYGRRPALDDISIEVRPGEIVGLLGPNGAGKSTLLKVIAGMVPPSHGTCRVSGHEIRGPDATVTFVPQRTGADWTFPISVLDVALLGGSRGIPRFRGFNTLERQQALKALRSVHMEHLAHVQIGTLSGGQQQRVFLARALLAGGEVLILDEPFTGVDIPTQEIFVSLMTDLARQGIAIVYATHDLAHARQTANRVILLNRRVVAEGSPNLVFTSEHMRAAFGGQAVIVDTSAGVVR